MATIVTQGQAPWYGQLAAGVLGTLINNMITNSQQANQNAKNNAVLAEALKINDTPGQLSGYSSNPFNASTNSLLGDVINSNAPTLADPNAGYNFNFNNNNAYQQAGYNNLNYGVAPVNNGLTLGKIAQALANEPYRFRNVNMGDIAKMAEPYVAEAEAARQRAELDAASQTIFNNGNFSPEQLTMLYLRGLIGDNQFNNSYALNAISPYQQEQINLSKAQLDEQRRQSQAQQAYNYARLGQDDKQFGLNLAERQRESDIRNAQWDKTFGANQDAAKWNRDHASGGQYVKDKNGNVHYLLGAEAMPVYGKDGGGDDLLINPQQPASGKAPVISPEEQNNQNEITRLKAQIDEVEKQINDVYSQAGLADKEETRQIYMNRVKELESKRNGFEQSLNHCVYMSYLFAYKRDPNSDIVKSIAKYNGFPYPPQEITAGNTTVALQPDKYQNQAQNQEQAQVTLADLDATVETAKDAAGLSSEQRVQADAASMAAATANLDVNQAGIIKPLGAASSFINPPVKPATAEELNNLSGGAKQGQGGGNQPQTKMPVISKADWNKLVVQFGPIMARKIVEKNGAVIGDK